MTVSNRMAGSVRAGAMHVQRAGLMRHPEIAMGVQLRSGTLLSALSGNWRLGLDFSRRIAFVLRSRVVAVPNFLDRFRPVGSPGAAAAAGVPASDVLSPPAELVPVFGALAADVETCRRLVSDARLEADRELVRAHEQADALLAQARLDIGAARAAAAARVMLTSADQDARMLDDAAREAADLEAAGTARLPATVQKVIDTLLAEQLALP